MHAFFFSTVLFLSASALASTPTNHPSIHNASGKMYHNGWIDFNKNGKKDVYEDSKATVDARVEDLLKQMNINEKTAQMVTLYGYRRVAKDQLPTPAWKTRVWKDGLANIDEHCNGVKAVWALQPRRKNAGHHPSNCGTNPLQLSVQKRIASRAARQRTQRDWKHACF